MPYHLYAVLGLAISGNETGNERPFLATSEEVFYLGNRSIAKREMRTRGVQLPSPPVLRSQRVGGRRPPRRSLGGGVGVPQEHLMQFSCTAEK
jgi:hypothetical protein